MSKVQNLVYRQMGRWYSSVKLVCPVTDNFQIVATFDMTDVGKQDMHVSFKADKVIVTWRKVRIIEKREDDALVRERKEKQYSQIIPLAEETSVRQTKFDPTLANDYEV